MEGFRSVRNAVDFDEIHAGGGQVRSTVDNTRKLDLRKLTRSGIAKKGGRCTFDWNCSRDLFHEGRATLEFRGDQAWIEWEFTDNAPPVPSGGILVDIVSVRANFGGSRRFFECPSCAKRALVLYFCEEGLACRTCASLAYPSQCLARGERAAYMASRIRSRLGGAPNVWDERPQRPPGMRRKTYRDLIDRLSRFEEIYVEETAPIMEALSKKFFAG